MEVGLGGGTAGTDFTPEVRPLAVPPSLVEGLVMQISGPAPERSDSTL